MFRILLLLFFISLPLFAANILSYKIHNNETQNIEITLSLDDEWKGFVEQKNTNEEMVFIFKGLRIKSPAQKLQNFSDTEYAELIQPNADESQLILKSEQMFDATISNKMNEIHISLTPKSAPLTIEGIANSANYGSITAYILDVLL
ncbi:MAG: hypothetical protein LBH45_03390, partial [Campylobacteraceae bacterium]|nr:hypothetical protein [Campylobacteraceae bacterium]